MDDLRLKALETALKRVNDHLLEAIGWMQYVYSHLEKLQEQQKPSKNGERPEDPPPKGQERII
jgi:hypothetical protein